MRIDFSHRNIFHDRIHVTVPLRFKSNDGCGSVDYACRRIPARPELYAVSAGKLCNPVVFCVIIFQAFHDLLLCGRGVKAKIRKRKTSEIAAVILGREIISLRLAVHAYPGGFFLCQMQMVEQRLVIVIELGKCRPRTILRHKVVPNQVAP